MMHYKIQVLDVGFVDQAPANNAFDGAYKNGEFQYSPFCFFLLRGGDRNILIDCGIDFRAQEGTRRFLGAGGANGRSPDEVLATVGLLPEDIDIILLTHCHWDHMDGLSYFPGARVYVQKEEVGRWKDLGTNPAYAPVFSMQMAFSNLNLFDEFEKTGQLVYLEGETDDLLPGLHVRVSRFGHSFAHQMVIVDTDNERFVIAGDVCNRRENLLGTKERPGYMPNVKFAVGSVLNTLQDYDRILSWVGGNARNVLMTHDGQRQDCYPCVKSELGLNIFEIYN